MTEGDVEAEPLLFVHAHASHEMSPSR